MEKSSIAGLMLILIDIFNLGEQFGIYFISKEDDLDETSQQRFFFILFGVGGAELILPMFLWSKLKIFGSILIEIAELICYLLLLPRTTNLIIVSIIFFVIEIILHLISLYATKSNMDEITLKDCLRDIGCFPVRIFLYGLIYSSPILFLFLESDSNFRDTYYENLLILNIFFGVTYIDLMITLCCTSDSERSNDEIIYLVWQYGTMIIYNILSLIIMITTMIFAGQAIQKHNSGVKILPQYDYGVYIYCLVNYSLYGTGQLMQCCTTCTQVISKNSKK